MAETEHPIRNCCQQHHLGPVCPDGLVMCRICFKRVSRDRLHVLDDGDGAEVSSAPIYEDVCRACRARERLRATPTPRTPESADERGA